MTIIKITVGLLFLFCCFSCGPSFHLRKAERHIRKAEEKGAVWHRDTLFKKIQFKVPGVDVRFSSQIITPEGPMIFEKDSVITKVTIIKGKDNRDTVFVETKCPDKTIVKEIPIAINNEIKAGKSIWGVWFWFLLAFVVGFFMGRMTK